MLYKNILLEAYGNPCTAEELSVELGVALPYMEDELERLTRETFLLKSGNEYQTAFPIISRYAQEQTHIAWLSAAPSITKALMDFINRLNDAFVAQGKSFYGKYQDYESAKWSLLMLAFDCFLYKAPGMRDFTLRPDHGRWDVIGYQHCQVTEPNFVGNHVSKYGFHHYRYEFDGISAQTPNYLADEEARVLYDFVSGNTVEENCEIITKLTDYGYLRKIENTYEPTIVTLNMDEISNTVKTLDASVQSELTVLADHARKLMKDLYDEIYRTVCADLPTVFLGDTYQCSLAVSGCYFCRGYVMEEALNKEYLLSADKVSTVIGAHIYLN